MFAGVSVRMDWSEEDKKHNIQSRSYTTELVEMEVEREEREFPQSVLQQDHEWERNFFVARQIKDGLDKTNCSREEAKHN